jgi:hypothetical protein
MNQTVEPLNFTVPLSFEAHAAAYAAVRSELPQTQQTYLKALAIYAVEYYLRCLGIETDPNQSDWRNPWMAKLIDVADLWLEPYGKLECCYMLPNATVLSISPDAWADRIGYLAVQFTPTLKAVTLLGFTPTPVADLPLSELQSLDQFPDYLQGLRHSSAGLESRLESGPRSAFTSSLASGVSGGMMGTNQQIINLRKWLEGIVETGWQTVEPQESTQIVAVRGQEQFEIAVRQAKLIDVGMDLGEQSVVLSLAITLNPDTSMNVLVQTHPAPGQSYLLPNLKLAMLSETGDVLQEVCSREQDSYIQLRHFRGEAGDSFDIRVSFDQVNITESFIL